MWWRLHIQTDNEENEIEKKGSVKEGGMREEGRERGRWRKEREKEREEERERERNS